jgi:hypothetical protein
MTVEVERPGARFVAAGGVGDLVLTLAMPVSLTTEGLVRAGGPGPLYRDAAAVGEGPAPARCASACRYTVRRSMLCQTTASRLPVDHHSTPAL